MLNFKIIETGASQPDLLLYRERDENSNEMVNILAIGKIGNEDDGDMFVIETVEFGNADAAKSFISDFSKKPADMFCQRNAVTYS